LLGILSMTLGDIPVGGRARIVGFNASSAPFRRKLLSFGLLPGTEVAVVRVAPLGDPLELKVRGYALSLRRQEAAVLEVENL
ncbi:MAG: ferrous iron transport protein A, partial [Rhodocyclaceae bacterium]|nr:ferrous iron transport protein A [Rhodocyclaceae bacterium]